MYSVDDDKDRAEDLHILYAEQPSPTAFGEPAHPRVERLAQPDSTVQRAASKALAVTWRDWFRTRTRFTSRDGS